MTKKQKALIPDGAYKQKPKFSISILKENFSELFNWLKQISRESKIENFIYISDYKKGEIQLKIFTKDHQYYISAHLPKIIMSSPEIESKNGITILGIDGKKDGGYLKCIAEARKPRAGEDWNRGNDLANGNYSEKIWQEIKDDILAYELVKVVRNSPDNG